MVNFVKVTENAEAVCKWCLDGPCLSYILEVDSLPGALRLRKPASTGLFREKLGVFEQVCGLEGA
jgi:hypothetical protein